MNHIAECKYNNMVECAEKARNCTNCGWNPVVKEKRVEKVMREIGKRKGSR